MEHVTNEVEVNGWEISRAAGLARDGSTRLKAAEALARFAEAEKFRAAAMLHAEAQRAVPSLLDDLDDEPGMGISLRSGNMASFAATESASLEIALVLGLSPGQGHRILDQADTLVGQTPEVIESLTAGRIGAVHVQRILDQVKTIQPDVPPYPGRQADEATREEWERERARLETAAQAARRDFGADMLAAAPGKSPAQLRTRGRQLLEKYYDISYTKRCRTALRDRRIIIEDAADGMSWLSALLPTARCQTMYSMVDAVARALKADPDAAAAVLSPDPEQQPTLPAKDLADDPAELRTLEQLRADVFMDMVLDGVCGKGNSAIQPEVFVTIPATMLPGLPGGPRGIDDTATDGTGACPGPAGDIGGAGDDPPPVQVGTAELPPGALVPTLLGGGPVDQESAARFMAAAKTWWRVVTDPMTGAIVEFGQNKYRPTAAQRAALRFRDGGCCTPGCPGRVEHCDADHVQEWHDGGGTDLGNLGMRCRRCHRLKSLGLLHFEQGADGSTVVTSLFGTRQGTSPSAPWAAGTEPSARGVDPDGPDDASTPGSTAGNQEEPPACGEWGKVQDVPDPSCENPEFGRYAKSSQAKGTRKRRLKRNAGGYGPRKSTTQGRVDPWESHSGSGEEGTEDIPF
ncbi:DUF222 domain-containing protein [Arthrobacter sp.]|uniref:HNH endonuclease n=1 Tax=Arthrobacter sp. TaxID=1667 RepID=UPI003A92FFDD